MSTRSEHAAVLVVDDNRERAQYIASKAEQIGHNVIVGTNSTEAQRFLNTGHILAIIMRDDLGWELIIPVQTKRIEFSIHPWDVYKLIQQIVEQLLPVA